MEIILSCTGLLLSAIMFNPLDMSSISFVRMCSKAQSLLLLLVMTGVLIVVVVVFGVETPHLLQHLELSRDDGNCSGNLVSVDDCDCDCDKKCFVSWLLIDLDSDVSIGVPFRLFIAFSKLFLD